ncbi:MAG: cell wall hydrolase [Lachnospiraceae bacterium]|nr:cell wall hydrolase [Lachnospiraceae bacterium]
MFRRKPQRVCQVILLLLCFFAGVMKPAALHADSIQQKINDAEKEKKHLENRLDDTREDLAELKSDSKVLKRELNSLNDRFEYISSNIEDLENKIAEKQEELNETQATLEATKASEATQYANMITRIRNMYEMNDGSFINALFSSKSVNSALNSADYFEKIAAYDQRKLEEYRATRAVIEEEEAKLQNQTRELYVLKEEATAQKEQVSNLIYETAEALEKYSDQIETVQAQALEYEAQVLAKDDDIEKLKKQLEAEKALSEKAANSSWRDISNINFEVDDRKLLATIIFCEAGGEPYEGQVAVGSVVMNRVMSVVYPDTIAGVIYQKGQFTPVGSGRFAIALGADKATESCYRAADEAMSGNSNVGNCVYFRTPIPGLSGINIGGHVFY